MDFVFWFMLLLMYFAVVVVDDVVVLMFVMWFSFCLGLCDVAFGVVS